jgi:excisionase family DNA binding protein
MSQVEIAEKALHLKQQDQQRQFLTGQFLGQDDRDVLLTRAEAAAYLRRSVPTLETWAREGTGPPITRLGSRSIRYRLSDLRAWIDANTATSGR